MKTGSRYVVTVATCQAPSSGGGRFRRPVVVRVLDTTAGPSKWHWVRYGVVSEWRNVDSRYDGPRSAYGQALAAAHAECDALNSPMELATAT